MSGWKLGCDVGGTFTDCILYNTDTGETYRAKTISTPHDQSIGVLNAIEEVRAKVGRDVRFSVLNHGTTIATNAILEGKGARVALLVTDGYKDVLQVKRSNVPGGLAGWIVWPKPDPLVDLELTVEVPGRISTSGEIVDPFNPQVLSQRLARLKALQHPPDSITISLINAFINPVHERAVRDLVLEEFPGIPISLSSEVLPELGEYERTLTTVADAYVKPVVGHYVKNLQEKLGDTELRVLRSDGGLTSGTLAKDQCANLLYSGPAGGVAGVVAHVAGKTKFKNLLTFDIGGTSTDVCLIENGVPELRRESTIGDLTIRAPSVDVRTVGAGGGSIAQVASITGALRVGPESAGARPGPACYSQGGVLPTVTDACAALGYLPPALLGGSFKLDITAARTAVESHVARPMGLSIEDAAEGILKLAVERMYGSLRSVSVEKGKDMRNFALVAFGGAGGMLACQIAYLCQSYPSIVPPSPGVLCAFGDACTSMRYERTRSILRRFSDLKVEHVIQTCLDLAAQAAKTLEKQGVTSQAESWEADMRYRGQGLTLPVAFSIDELKQGGFKILEERFNESHKILFTFALDNEIELCNLRAVATEVIKDVVTQPLEIGTGLASLESITQKTTVISSSLEKAGDQLAGPCIISEADSNTFINPIHRAEIDEVGNILIWPVVNNVEILSTVTPSKASLDPIIVQLVEAALQNIRTEMDVLIQRVAMSPAMREQLDYFPMIAAGDGPNSGKMVCGQFGSFIPGFLRIWEETIKEGDVFLTNDPYSVNFSISHLNDFLVINPVFYDGKIVAWTANLGHFTDIGSCVPGSMPNCARSIHEDGIQIPLSKLYDGGIPNKAIVERNSRKPNFARSDLHALVAATKIAERRIIEMIQRFGLVSYEAALDELLLRNKTAIGKLIATAIPDESVYFEDFIDDDGHGLGDTVCFDFNGTDPQSERSINFALSHEMLKMFIVYYLLTVFDPSTVVNDGSFELIEINIPVGTILNPVRPAALSCRTHLLGRVFDVLGALFGQRQPEYLSAAGFSDSPHFFYSGYDSSGEWFQLYQIGFGGIPARPFGDGPDGHSLWPSMRAVPNEFLESFLPLRVDRYETVVDSGGEGLYRGGNAMRIDYSFLEPGNISIHDDRWLTKPWGVHGGGTGSRSRKTLVKYSVDKTNPPRIPLGSKEDFVEVAVGDTLEWVTWGGGGWGNPLTRDPELVAKEVRRRLVKDASRYGVALTASGDVDVAATEALRADMSTQQSVKSADLFNRGGTVKELLERCEEETGLKPPKLPSSRILRGPISKMPHIQALHRRRLEEDKDLLA
ncbi:Hydantoinase/oxoprolinase-domain-containing protein [Rhodocollybia butyracea]|uniref:Hydantoinase/oxoprolinase-domain-containing protein n=1 Tax=Rhodocollybia butyracea TaxID=206335 RepID=A0A9P5PP01_9AGAR|nr:Hydantoinase/oxoprolinase-domain-containing protein [Rhodocollybia butyracea]